MFVSAPEANSSPIYLDLRGILEAGKKTKRGSKLETGENERDGRDES